MRITSITVRNYRVHRDRTVELDSLRTLIGGPNEVGKSTLVEAAHRALFLKAKITGETQKGMISRFHRGHPEVEVCFESGGRSYRIAKRFSGPTGTTTLSDANGATLHGDEAESRLAAILGVEGVGGGRGVGERAAQQWSHLWVWQGQSGNDPKGYANTQRDSLLARLQGQGGAAIMQSELDASVSAKIEALHTNLFTKDGRPKKDSDLGRAIQQDEEARNSLSEARQAFERLEKAAADFRMAEDTIKSCVSDLRTLEAEKTNIDEKMVRVAELKTAEQTQSMAAQIADSKYEALAQADARIQTLSDEIGRRSATLEPKEREIERLGLDESESRKREKAADDDHQMAVGRVRLARQRNDLAAAQLTFLEKSIQRDQLRERLKQITDERSNVANLNARLAKVPGISGCDLKALEKFNATLCKAEAALEASAAEIEVMVSDLPVEIGQRTLTEGESAILTDETDVAIGPHVRLRIKPGGGTSLLEARMRVQESREKLQQRLDQHAVRNVAEAAEACALRQQLEADIKTATKLLEAVGAESIDQNLADAEQFALVAEAEVERRRVAIEGDMATPADLTEARSALTEAAQWLHEAEIEESSRKAAWDTALKDRTIFVEAVTDLRRKIELEKSGLDDLRAELRVMLSTYGEETERRPALAECLAAKDAAADRVAQTSTALAALQPDLLEADRKRIQRAIDQCMETKNQAEQQLAVARNILQSDGGTDPQAALTIAQDAARLAADHLTSIQRKADSIQLLHQLFRDEQRALADQFTGPLAEKISDYLQCLFGVGTRALVSLEENSFTGVQIVRPGVDAGAFSFDSLSGGAREQLAAAVRLAMAEVLAETHDNCLPLVFDDSFAYSDPDRVQTMQRMLDHAATRGLQIIVLTCNPSDYASLGAKQILLGT
jgi:DNA repair exonuclease SbcCD ATPase subunit